MRKEVVFAIFFGILFGLVIAFGVWRLNTSLSSKKQSNNTEATPAPTQSPDSLGLTISKPSELAVFRNSSVSVEGATKASSWVVISGEEDDRITTASQAGAFSADLELTGGLNQIVVTSFNESGDKSQKTILVVYSSQFPQPTEESNESTQSAVDQKLKEAQNPPLAYIGTVTDISENTVHLRNSSEEIKQAAVANDTTYANEITKKEVKFKDIAIGDFVIAMGYRNGNQVLNAKRMVVASAPKSPNRNFYLGNVKAIKNKIMSLTKPDGDVELAFPKTWKGPDIDEIENGDKVIVVTNSESKNSIRTIQIVR